MCCRVTVLSCLLVFSASTAAATLDSSLITGDMAHFRRDSSGAPRLAGTGTWPGQVPRRVLRATRVIGDPPTLDGHLNEPVWRQAGAATDFVQHAPQPGEPATQSTEVYLLYDDDAIYVGVRLHDSAPDSVVAHLARRDEDVHSDWFFVALDSYHDRRTAFVFGVNPRGVRRDLMIYNDSEEDAAWDAVWDAAARIDSLGWTAELRIPFSQLRFATDERQALQTTDAVPVQVDRETARPEEPHPSGPAAGIARESRAGSRQQQGGTRSLPGAADVDASRSPASEANTSLGQAHGERGTAALPGRRALDVGAQHELVWGVNFRRRIARRDEVAYWSPVPADAAGLVSFFGELRGLRGIEAPNRLELQPYTVTRLTRAPGDPADPLYRRNDVFGSAGMDITYGLTSDLTLSATFNPDFGQVEADPSVVNLTAYETFFQEKRPFFLEGAEVFQTRGPQLLYSRRIGRQPQGSLPGDAAYGSLPDATTILGATKLTGKTAGGWSIGVLDAVTAAEQARYVEALKRGAERDVRGTPVEPLTNYAAARVRKDFREGQSAVGAIFTATNRALPGVSETADVGSSTASPAGSSNSVADSTKHYPPASAGPLDFMPSAAYTGGIDARHRFGDGDYEVEAGIYGSHVRGSAEAIAGLQRAAGRYFQRPDAEHLTYAPDRKSLSGWASRLQLEKIGGGHWRWSLYGSAYAPGFEVNDLGFNFSTDEIFTSASGAYKEFRPGDVFREWEVSSFVLGEWTFGGERLETVLDMTGSFRLQNHWSGHAWVQRALPALSVDALRGGPAIRKPAETWTHVHLFGDDRKPVRFDLGTSATFEDQTAGRSITVTPALQLRPSTRLKATLAPNLSWNTEAWQYVVAYNHIGLLTPGAPHYVLGQLKQTTASLTLRLDYTFRPDLSLQFYAQPFVSAGDYSRFMEVVAPRAERFDNRFRMFREEDEIRYDSDASAYTVDLDADGAADFSFADPDFNISELRSNLVLRWAYRPGSTLFLVWSQGRTASEPIGSFDLPRAMNRLFSAEGTNVLLLKVSYWFGL